MYKLKFNDPIHIHFIGIGGISMSGLAEILLEKGFTISGSDAKESDLTRMLASKGAQIFYGQSAENIIPGIDLVVYTAAIHPDNPEFAEARSQGLPMLSRAELLGQIMDNYNNSVAVAGTHGKTTTTSMISEILLAAKSDPTITVGGILPSIGGNLRVGHSGIFVSEACICVQTDGLVDPYRHQHVQSADGQRCFRPVSAGQQRIGEIGKGHKVC